MIFSRSYKEPEPWKLIADSKSIALLEKVRVRVVTVGELGWSQLEQVTTDRLVWRVAVAY
jgi:hypothetical protein